MRFPIQLPSFEDPSVVLPPAGGGPEPIREPRTRRCQCEFCDCTLTAGGEVLAFSDKARKMRNLSETIEKLEREKSALDSEIRDLKAKLVPVSEPTRRRTSPVAIVGGE